MIETHTGTDRIVLVGDHYALKVPKSNPGRAVRNAYGLYERFGFGAIVETINRERSDSLGGIKGELLHGVAANWREARLARLFPGVVAQTRNIVGVNIQPRLEHPETDGDTILRIFAGRLKGRTAIIGHVLEQASNFGITPEGVVFVDGGSTGLDRILTKEGREEAVKYALQDLVGIQNEKD